MERSMKKTVSAGGVVLNPDGDVLAVNQNGDSWSLPKGHIDPGETARQAAEREIAEESGITQVQFVRELGTYERPRIGISGQGDDPSETKTIIMFLFRTDQTALAPTDPHNPEARWVRPDGVADLLTHSKDKAFFNEIRDQL
jgi:ADP-ribose pyrophosphatase YjhB (NUDIX family)